MPVAFENALKEVSNIMGNPCTTDVLRRHPLPWSHGTETLSIHTSTTIRDANDKKVTELSGPLALKVDNVVNQVNKLV